MRTIALLLGLVAALASAQSPEEPARAAFVSRLQAQPGERCVLLSWRNPAQSSAYKLLYRSAEPIRTETLAAATLVARLGPEVEGYEDTPPDGASYFYALLLEGPEGKPIAELLPLRNKTSQGVRASAAPLEQQPAAEITELQAEVAGDFVRLSFRSSQPHRPLLVFRSPTPIISAADLAGADPPAALPGAQEYVDYAVPGLDNYYAVLDAGSFESGGSRIAAGANATLLPVQVPASVPRAALPRAPAKRPLPLPYLRLPEAAADLAPQAHPLPLRPISAQAPQPLGAATRETLARLLPAAALGEPGPRSVQVFEQHFARWPTLQKIVREHLQTGAYAEAENALRGLLMIPRPEDSEAPLRFYLGQSLYMQELYAEAALEFALIRDSMYSPVQPWLEDSLRLLRLQGSAKLP